MAKAVKKKSAKEASIIFHNIMKASMKVDINKNGKGAKEWIPFEYKGRNYIIRYYYDDENKQRKCTVGLESNDLQNPEEITISTFNYSSERQGIEVDEVAKMKAVDYGNMQPSED